MAKSSNQKLKLLYLVKIFMDETDDTHGISISEIIGKLKNYGISAERKSIYSDIDCLRQYKIDIIGEKIGHDYRYHIGSRRFELPELKLLVDLVQASKFITSSKSDKLVEKLGALASNFEAQQLKRQVFVANRVKTTNRNIYLNVDAIHRAIASNCKISFQYFRWNVKKEKELRRNGQFYEVSPWALLWSNENYYLIAYDADAGIIKHYRVDKMLKITEIEDEECEGRECFEKIDVADYPRKMFDMYDGEECEVRMVCDNSLAGVIIDRFGTDIMLFPAEDGEHFSVTVRIAVSKQFLHWAMALGNGVRITGPQNVVEKIREEIDRLNEQYKED